MFMNKFFSAVLLAIIYSSYANAAPWPQHARHATHKRHVIGSRGLEVRSYHPRSTYKTYGAGRDHPNPSLLKRDSSLKAAASSFVMSELGLDEDKFRFRAGHSGPKADYAYLRQYHDGIPIANAVANVAMRDGKVMAFGNSFSTNGKFAPSTPSFERDAAISVAEEQLEGKRNEIEPRLEYFVKDDGSVSLTHAIQVRNPATTTFYKAYVDAHSGKLISVVDYVSKASYTVLPISKETLEDGEETLVDPADLESSPLGWHNDGVNTTNATAGNNVVAFIGKSDNITLESSEGQVFDYPYDTTLEPSEGGNPDASRTNGFYLYNTMHDIAYRYGFTETAFNFQVNNFNKGGNESDPVLVSVQDPSGTDNAFFMTPPDGQSGETSMFLFTATKPERDGVMENDVPVHECTHGITNRMTGGGTGECLSSLEAGGMGEGWSDAMAEWVQQKSAEIKDFVLGAYVSNNSAGIRSHPYSTDKSVNPLTYADVGNMDEEHNIGEVWANMLHNVYAALVEAKGFSENAKTDPSTEEGNVVFLHLFMDALLLQPCNPRFQDARDAWIQADVDRYDGAHKCLVYNAFASRGLGVKAENFKNDFSVPAECESTNPQPSSTGTTSATAEAPSSTTEAPSTTDTPSSTTEAPSTTDAPSSTTLSSSSTISESATASGSAYPTLSGYGVPEPEPTSVDPTSSA